MTTTRSPLAPKTVPTMPAIDGVAIATAEAAIKYKGRTDLLLMTFAEGTSVAGVFTRSKCPSAPVDWCRANLPNGTARALVVNSGNANAFTGRKGRATTAATAEAAAGAVGCEAGDVYLCSTGVIGEPLDASRFTPLLSGMTGAAKADRWREAAEAIMTTDTYPKVATQTVELPSGTVTINGIAKGAGMIAPDMATMLAFIATDAAIPAELLQSWLGEANAPSFNAVTVDSDTSTSDTLLAFATGKATARGVEPIDSASGPGAEAFRKALAAICHDLALQVVRDGEGVRKMIEVRVTGAATDSSADRIARAIANSPLVKTAVAGEDANWGRVVMAVGKAGEPADRDRLTIRFGDQVLAREGERAEDYSEEAASRYMEGDDIVIGVDLGLAEGSATVWGCDLTKDYVAINGDYRS